MSTNTHRISLISDRARILAQSGRHLSYQSIETELCFVEGLHDARAVLDQRFFRAELDALCAEARAVPDR